MSSSPGTANTVHSIDSDLGGGLLGRAVHMTYFEKDAILSGLGISRIGRRTGIPGLELTMEAVRAAIEDAGLAPADIDGIATLGDTPADPARLGSSAVPACSRR